MTAPGLVGGRPLGLVWRSLGEARHYRALANMARVYPRPVDALARYVLGRGGYPARVDVRTPAGRVRPRLYTRHDMLTLNEVFCRLDYELAGPARVVVDVGSNIGLSALYFLTRPSRPFCYLYEPDPRNVARLRDNLAGHADRWELAEAAVGARGGRVRFSTEKRVRASARSRAVTTSRAMSAAVLPPTRTELHATAAVSPWSDFSRSTIWWLTSVGRRVVHSR